MREEIREEFRCHYERDTTSIRQHVAKSCLNGAEKASNTLWKNADAVAEAEASVAK